MKKLLLTMLVFLMAIPAFAYDFEYTYEGQTITYTVIDEDAKTCQIRDGWRGPGNNIRGNLILPSHPTDGFTEYTLTAIGGSAFLDCTELTSISIPNSVTKIDGSAFRGCSGLTSISIPNSVTEIRDDTFSGCSGLTSISFPNSVTEIGESAFRGCSGLTSISIPNSVTEIRDYTFSGCSGLTSISIPEAVKSIGTKAFYDCRGLTKAEFASIEHLCSIYFDDSSSNPLNYARNLYINGEEVKEVVIPESFTRIGQFTFIFCDKLTSITIPNSVKEIGMGAFFLCMGLTSISIPDTVTEIGRGAFSSCHGLTSISIPDSVTEVGWYAFIGCSALETVTLSENLEVLEDNVFQYCDAIKNVIYKGETPVWATKNIFEDSVYDDATLYVKEGKISSFQEVSPWKYFKNITDKEYVSGVEDVIVEENSGVGKEIYNINGVKVSNSTDTLVPGIYIVRQGSKTKKIVVK